MTDYATMKAKVDAQRFQILAQIGHVQSIIQGEKAKLPPAAIDVERIKGQLDNVRILVTELEGYATQYPMLADEIQSAVEYNLFIINHNLRPEIKHLQRRLHPIDYAQIETMVTEAVRLMTSIVDFVKVVKR
jgi:hypothetical protein